MRIEPVFCPAQVADPFDTVEWSRRTAAIKGEGGELLFEQTDCEVPASWTQLATNVVVSKYFYGEVNTPQRETSVRQVIHRVTRTIADWGLADGYFATRTDAESFYRELTWLCLHQHGAFNSPVWFNVGLFHQYGVKGSQCNWIWDPESETVTKPENPYEYPQGSACFIQSVQDDMEDIMELARSEAMLFKFGSGTGTDLSSLRSHREKLSGGGKPSGPLSFMRVYDQIAAVVKSGGKTRRAAKMQSLKVWHPDIMEFIECKAKEERKARLLIQHGGYDANFNGEAYSSILFQNANLSVRVSDEFMHAVETDGQWHTHWVTDPARSGPHWPAREVLSRMAASAWQCGDPGVQYDTTINRWNTCSNSGRINASNPCVTGDTLVATAKGWQRIDSLVGETPRVIGLDGNLHATTRVIPTGTKPVYRLRTRSGYQLRLTADHRVWTEGETDVAAKDLQPGIDRIRLQHGSFGDELLDERHAEYIGVLAARGVIDSHRVVLLLGDDVPLEAKFRFRDAREQSGASRQWSSGIGAAAVAVADVDVIDDLARKYVKLGNSLNGTSLCESIFRLDRESVAALLRGLFTTAVDRAFIRGGSVVRISLKSPELLRQVQLLLLSFGIVSQHSDSTSDTLEVVGDDERLFAQEIGFLAEELQTRASGEGSRRVVPRSKIFDEVESIEYVGEEPVYDLTEPVTDHFVANGIVVHNCSEYMFLDDTACNLASINLLKFRRADGQFDAERFRAACRIYFIAQEILVDHASYPTQRIAHNSHRFRPLGLGYSNLGSLIMTAGLPYDSDAARGMCGAITALLHGAANLASTELAAAVGPFERFEHNREPMLNVMQMHRDAADHIDPACPADLKRAAVELWDEVLASGRAHGFRNAQATVLAPTGTISFMMDCDTTGIEPDIALVKYKQLAGGGMLKIINQTVPLGLAVLGYDEPQVRAICDYIEAHDTIEGAAELKPEHLPVFDCAFVPKGGTRSIPWRAHVLMMAAAQPFLSGAISKTVNMPRDTTPEDIAQAYVEGWRLGLKALAVYRDGSKESQPLSTSSETEKAAQKLVAVPRRERLPDTRKSITHKFSIAGHEGYLTVGLYDDGRPGEVFVTMAKEGSTIGGLMDCFGTAVSMSLQYGVPLEVYVKKFSHTRFEPMGHTKNPDIRIAKSIVDYIFRWLGIQFLPGYKEAMLGVPEETAGGGEALGQPAPAAPVATAPAAAPPAAKPAKAAAANGHKPAPDADLLERAGAAMRVDQNGGGRQEQFASFQVDAPACDNCGAITVRNGNCYLCHNCGNSMGCS